MKIRLFVIKALLFAFIKPATADDYGCKVLLCLANPSGPMAVSMCMPPITKLYDDLAHGRAFPSCDMAAGPTGRSYAVQNTSYYDPCPTGTTALDAGLYAVQSGGTSASAYPETSGWVKAQPGGSVERSSTTVHRHGSLIGFVRVAIRKRIGHRPFFPSGVRRCPWRNTAGPVANHPQAYRHRQRDGLCNQSLP